MCTHGCHYYRCDPDGVWRCVDCPANFTNQATP